VPTLTCGLVLSNFSFAILNTPYLFNFAKYTAAPKNVADEVIEKLNK
jgi:hypothetical protein